MFFFFVVFIKASETETCKQLNLQCLRLGVDRVARVALNMIPTISTARRTPSNGLVVRSPPNVPNLAGSQDKIPLASPPPASPVTSLSYFHVCGRGGGGGGGGRCRCGHGRWPDSRREAKGHGGRRPRPRVRGRTRVGPLPRRARTRRDHPPPHRAGERAAVLRVVSVPPPSSRGRLPPRLPARRRQRRRRQGRLRVPGGDAS